MPAAIRHENSWLVIYLATGVWKGAGFGAVLYLAAIAGVSLDQYEAATLDGATRIQKTWYITLPSILPLIMIKLIMSVESVMNTGGWHCGIDRARFHPVSFLAALFHQGHHIGAIKG